MSNKRPLTKASKSYKVGKGRPPLETRWKSGQSGNPKGRPKGTKNLLTLFAEALDRKLKIRDSGKLRTVTTREAIVTRTVLDALKGDHKSRTLLLEYEPKISREAHLKQEQDFNDLPPEERATRASEAYLRLVRASRSEEY
jgi:hypothetical protein